VSGCLKSISKTLKDVAKKNHAVLRDIIEAAEKRADEIGAGFGGKKRLRGGENESDVDADTFFGEDAEGADAVGRHGNFRDDIGMPADHFAGFAKHAVVIGGDDFSADGAIFYDVADFDDELAEGLFFFGGEGGVGGDAVDYAGGCALADFVEICGIEEEFHFFTFVIGAVRISRPWLSDDVLPAVKRAWRAVPLLKTGYRIAKCADSGDAYFHYVAVSERADSRWCSGCDHIAGFERHHLSYPMNYNINGKDHF
jgi:hypothetical protein